LRGKLIADVDDAFSLVPPDEETLEVVVEHLCCEVGDDECQPKVLQEDGSEADDGDPLVRGHPLPHVPPVSEVEVDQLEILCLVVALVDLEMLEEFLVGYVVQSTQGILEELPRLLLLLVQGGEGRLGFTHIIKNQ
jgi:hypothetical protein